MNLTFKLCVKWALTALLVVAFQASENSVDISISTRKTEKFDLLVLVLRAYVVALTSENRVDISTSISTRPWTNHRSLWPRLHANIWKAIWRTLRPPSCLSLGWGELRTVSEKLFFVCCINIQDQSFNNFDNDTMKLSVNEKKLTSLWSRNCGTI